MSKTDLKIKLWVLGGRIFQILGGFLRGLILGEFSIYINVVETLKKTSLGSAGGHQSENITTKVGVEGAKRGGGVGDF